MQNQLPQIIIGLSSVIYHIKDFSVVIRRHLIFQKSFPGFEKNRFEILDFSPKFDQVRRFTLAHLSQTLK